MGNGSECRSVFTEFPDGIENGKFVKNYESLG
jgi:hypothetical protein